MNKKVVVLFFMIVLVVAGYLKFSSKDIKAQELKKNKILLKWIEANKAEIDDILDI